MLIEHDLRVAAVAASDGAGALRPAGLSVPAGQLLWPEDGPDNQRCYALLDATNVTFLAERLEQSGMPYACLYEDARGERLTASAPWLVALDPDARFTRELLTPAGAQKNPRFLLDARPGILLMSRADLPTLRHHLRHYTMLRDENGAGVLFRLQEPGFLPALLDKSSASEIAAFFRDVDCAIHWRAGFHDDSWEILTARPGPALPSPSAHGWPVPILGPVQRRALRDALYLRRAREMGMAHAAAPDERAARAAVYHRLLCAGYDGEPTFREGYEVVSRLPHDALLAFWRTIESEQYSLRFVFLTFAKANGLEKVMS